MRFGLIYGMTCIEDVPIGINEARVTVFSVKDMSHENSLFPTKNATALTSI